MAEWPTPWLSEQLAIIEDEARATKPAGMTQYDAVRELISERVERRILTHVEADALRLMQDGKLATTQGWINAGLIDG